jgi:hypothetical protein
MRSLVTFYALFLPTHVTNHMASPVKVVILELRPAVDSRHYPEFLLILELKRGLELLGEKGLIGEVRLKGECA